MLKVKNLSKRYKGQSTNAVDDVSFEVNNGCIYGIVGANGAGKSTLIKCLTGILPFESGKIEIDGIDINKDPEEYKAKLGYVSDDHSVYDSLTGLEYANFIGNIYKVPVDLIKQRTEYYTKRLNVEKWINSQIKTYSYGLKQKINILAALVHEPSLWVLDEPLSGLDPKSMNEIMKCMQEWKEKGYIVLFSSHNMNLVEKLCDELLIIKEGKIMKQLNVADYKKDSSISLEEYFLNIEFPNGEE